MRHVATIVGCLALGGMFGWGVPLERLFEAFQTMIGALSIMAAGLLVRLNRTMPMLDWKIIEIKARERLTKQIVDLAREYLILLGILAVLLTALVGLIVVGGDEMFGTADNLAKVPLTIPWPDTVQRCLSGLLGAAITLVIVRMAYVVWRDYDIVKLQKAVIDASAARAERDEQEKTAEEKQASIARAGLRSVSPPTPKIWGD